MLNRTSALRTLIKPFDEHLIVTGLGSAANDVAAITDHHPRAFLLDGVMGAAASIGLGLALAQPDQRTLVVTGDGELLMNIGTLATIAVQNPTNLGLIVIDNGRYGLTGGQVTATDTVADLELTARGLGIRRTLTVRSEADIPAAQKLLHEAGDVPLVVVRVEPGPAAEVTIERDGVKLRDRFRDHVLAHAGA